MKKTIGIVLAGVLTLSSAGLLAESNIGVLDMDKVVSESSQAKQIKTDMEKQFAPQKEKITALSKSFAADMKDYQKNKLTMSKTDLSALEKKMQGEQSDLQTLQAKVQQDLQTAQNKKMNEFLDSVKDASKTVAAKDKLDVVLPMNATVWSKDSLDITKDVLSAMDDKS